MEAKEIQDSVEIFEGGLAVVKQAASRLDAAGISSQIGTTGDSEPGS